MKLAGMLYIIVGIITAFMLLIRDEIMRRKSGSWMSFRDEFGVYVIAIFVWPFVYLAILEPYYRKLGERKWKS